MNKVFLHQFKKNFWFNFILISVWQIFIVAENDGFGRDNLWMLSCLYLIIFFRSLISPKLLYWFRRSKIISSLDKIGNRPFSFENLHELRLALIQAKCKIETFEQEDILDMYPKDIEKLKRLVKEY
jgi:hypothetical protein